LKSQGKDIEAETLISQALSIIKQTLGIEHPEYAKTQYNLAWFALKQGRFAEVFNLFQSALAISQRTLPPDHPQIKTIQANLDRLKAQMERNSPAKDDPGSKGDSA
jgi:tetratricopeptide (TPR) repeat protein